LYNKLEAEVYTGAIMLMGPKEEEGVMSYNKNLRIIMRCISNGMYRYPV
jgi:hypothetical protein